MTIARSKQICLEVTPYYHCTTRCVRKSYLCGYDKNTKRNFNHRKSWIEDRLLLLSAAFCIDVAAYSVMSNHYHVTLEVNVKASQLLTDKDVIDRWLTVYCGNALARRFIAGEHQTEDESRLLKESAKCWRKELTNISRFMGQINEKIARRANKEDKCKGRFWEARFDSQAILDVDSLIRTMVYDDLNPVRAKVAQTPESSTHTSIHNRLTNKKHNLIPFVSDRPTANPRTTTAVPITLPEYLDLLDWTGRQLGRRKKGAISTTLPPIFDRIRFTPESWIQNIKRTTNWTQKAIGSTDKIRSYCDAIGQRWIWQIPEKRV